jgi:hypothetical protein
MLEWVGWTEVVGLIRCRDGGRRDSTQQSQRQGRTWRLGFVILSRIACFDTYSASANGLRFVKRRRGRNLRQDYTLMTVPILLSTLCGHRYRSQSG